MALERCTGTMEVIIRDNGRMESNMVRVHFDLSKDYCLCLKLVPKKDFSKITY